MCVCTCVCVLPIKIYLWRHWDFNFMSCSHSIKYSFLYFLQPLKNAKLFLSPWSYKNYIGHNLLTSLLNENFFPSLTSKPNVKKITKDFSLLDAKHRSTASNLTSCSRRRRTGAASTGQQSLGHSAVPKIKSRSTESFHEILKITHLACSPSKTIVNNVKK